MQVELYADGISPLRRAIALIHPLADESGGYIYGAPVSANRPAADYTARVTPRCNGVAFPLEDPEPYGKDENEKQGNCRFLKRI